LAKHLKINIKNTQIAQAVNLGGLKEKLAKKGKKEEDLETTAPPPPAKEKKIRKKTIKEETPPPITETAPVEEAPPTRIRARSKSAFAEPQVKPAVSHTVPEPEQTEAPPEEKPVLAREVPSVPSSEELRRKIFGEEAISEKDTQKLTPTLSPQIPQREAPPPLPPMPREPRPPPPKLGPTGKHVKDLLPPQPRPQAPPRPTHRPQQAFTGPGPRRAPLPAAIPPKKPEERSRQAPAPASPAEIEQRRSKIIPKEFRDIKPKRTESQRFDARDRQGLRDADEDHRWRKKRSGKGRTEQEEAAIVRPTHLKVRIPISIKDLAAEMKLKSAQLVSKLFLQGIIVTLNDLLIDETTIQLLGQEFGCEITIDTSEEQRLRITDKSLKEEIAGSGAENLVLRPPIVAFMGHVDHGKTSLIDAIRKSNRAAGEAGAITQHIGAFRCHTPVGDITVLDTPGHEAFSAMRARGADVTDIVVLVVAGDEGMRQQTFEAVEHALAAKVTIVVAINKSDKPGFNPENVYRQLADKELLPEVWGGQILTVNCSATTGAGIKELLETLALQAEVLELRANPTSRARGTVIESEMHKGLGSVATVLVQNGSLRLGDPLVFGQHWGRVKTMQDEFGRNVTEAGPSSPVSVTGLSGLPAAGEEFIVVKSEKEAREIAEGRLQGIRQSALQQKKALTAEGLLQQATPTTKKTLNLILRADVQGSLEALKTALEKIESSKVDVAVLSTGVGEVSESDIQMASTSKAVVIGFHTSIEAHAEPLVRQFNVQVKLHDIIYHAIDDVKEIMKSLLDKIAQETDKGKAEVKALFKSSHAGVIAGCMVIDGTVHRSHQLRIVRNGEIVGRSNIASLKRVKEDVREVSKGQECGIVLGKFSDVQVGDILESYEVTYITQEI